MKLKLIFLLSAYLAPLTIWAGEELKQVVIHDTPDGALRTLIHGIADDRPDLIWNQLPQKYQKDVVGLLVRFSETVDGDIYDKNFRVLNKFVNMLDRKRDYVFASELKGLLRNHEKFQEHWDSGVELMRDLIDSEIKTVKGLKNLNIEKFLKQPGGRILKNAKLMLILANPQNGPNADIVKLKETKVLLKESNDEKATVEVTSPTGYVEITQLTRVDGKWVPSTIAKDWDKNIAKATQLIADFKYTADDKIKVLHQLATVEKILEKMDAANSQAEFDAAVKELKMVKR